MFSKRFLYCKALLLETVSNYLKYLLSDVQHLIFSYLHGFLLLFKLFSPLLVAHLGQSLVNDVTGVIIICGVFELLLLVFIIRFFVGYGRLELGVLFADVLVHPHCAGVAQLGRGCKLVLPQVVLRSDLLLGGPLLLQVLGNI